MKGNQLRMKQGRILRARKIIMRFLSFLARSNLISGLFFNIYSSFVGCFQVKVGEGYLGQWNILTRSLINSKMGVEGIAE